jgi:hypothetical protein
MKNDEARLSPEAAREEFFPGVGSEAPTEASGCPRVGERNRRNYGKVITSANQKRSVTGHLKVAPTIVA